MSENNHNTKLPRVAVIGLVTSMLGMTMTPFAVTGTNLSIQLIKEDFGASLASLSWALSGYAITIAALTMLGGAISARIGALRAFQLGVAIFVAASAMCALAPGTVFLIIGRIIQGVGGALIVPSSVSIALMGWPESRRNFAMGVWTGAFPIGASTAPIISSAIIMTGEWRWIFAVPFGLGLITLALSTFLQKGHEIARANNTAPTALPDLIGMVAGTVSTGLIALGLVEGNTWGWSNWKTVSVFCIAMLLIPFLILRSFKHPRPFLPVTLFRVPTFRVANIANVSVSMIGMSVWLLWPLVLGGLWKYDAWGIGLAMSPTPVLGGAGAIFSAQLVSRFGYRPLLSTGAVSLLFAMAWFALRTRAEAHYWADMFPGLILTGIGMGLLFSFLNAAALGDLPREDLTIGNATFTTGRFLSGAIGVAAIVATISGNADDPVAPFRRAYIFLFAMAVVAFTAIVVLWPRPQIEKTTQPHTAIKSK